MCCVPAPTPCCIAPSERCQSPPRQAQEQVQRRTLELGCCAIDGTSANNRMRQRYSNIPNQLPRKPQERLLEVVVGFGRDFKVLEVLLSVEGDRASLHFSLLRVIDEIEDRLQSVRTNLNIDFVAHKEQWGYFHRHARDRDASWERSCM